MTPDNIFASISALLSAIAIVISIVSLRRGSNQNTRLMDIESQRDTHAEFDRNSANLIAKLETKKSHSVTTGPVSKDVTSRYLVIKNIGPSGARNIRVLLQTNEPDSDNLFDSSMGVFNGSWDLGPSSEKDFLLALDVRKSGPSRIRITWKDDASDQKEYASTI